MTRTILQDLKQMMPVLPAPDKLLVLLNVPDVHGPAYVFFTGLDRALQRQYPQTNLRFVTQLRPWANSESIIFEYSGGRMVRRHFDEVQHLYP